MVFVRETPDTLGVPMSDYHFTTTVATRPDGEWGYALFISAYMPDQTSYYAAWRYDTPDKAQVARKVAHKAQGLGLHLDDVLDLLRHNCPPMFEG
jgi:hypothetical protein